MSILELNNIRFTSRYLWGAFCVSFLYIPLIITGIIDPEQTLIRALIPLSVIIASALVFVSLAKREKQTFFALVVAVVVFTIATFPLIFRPEWPPLPVLTLP